MTLCAVHQYVCVCEGTWGTFLHNMCIGITYISVGLWP